MSKHLFFTGLVIVGATVCTAILAKATVAIPQTIPSVPKAETTVRVETDAPICYIQFQGNSAIDMSNVCGKTPGETPTNGITTVSKAAAPPIFDPNVVNASTTGQCNFVDADGKPCPQE